MKSHAVSVPREYPELHAPKRSRQHARSTAAQTAQFVDAYLPALLAQAHELVASEFHAIAAEHGLAPSEWRVLATLAGGEPTSIGRLAQIVVMKQPTVTRLLDRMEATGHVRRVPHDGDRRITLVTITPDGQQLTEKLVPLARDHEARVLAPFGTQRANELKDSLLTLIRLQQEADEGALSAI
jgi:DNA-binding MarR family transcriptional regulator